MEILLGILAVAGVGILIALQFRQKTTEGISPAEFERLKADLERRQEDVSDLKTKLEKAVSEKDEMSGKGKQLYDNFKNLEADVKIARQERDVLQREVQEYQANERRKEKEFTERLEKLGAAQQKLEEERQRVIREDEEARKRLEEERDRLWADHENGVIASLTDLCKQPTYFFTSYTNNNLPDGFDGSLKPDFMIDFLGQYVIFDAKVSKAKSLKTYIEDQVKKTIEKVKENESIYKTIFLVVPAAALSELKKHHYDQDGYSIFVICPESIPAVLASFKRITLYEFAEQMDPQERENIIQLIAELDFHINLRNATDIILSKVGTDLLKKAQRLDPDLAEEVALKKKPMNAKASIASAEIKRIVAQLSRQEELINELVSPHAAIEKSNLQEAQQLLSVQVL